MNFTPFGTTFSGALPTTGGAVAQFTTAKFAHQVGSGGGQVVGLLSSDDAGVTYLRPVDANGFTLNLAQQSTGNNSDNNPQIITLPISVPGAKPGDLPQQQTLQIQVVNPGGGAGGAGGEKYTAVPISIQPFQQGGATVLTVAYSNAHQDQGDAIQLQLQTADGEHVNQQTNNNNNSSSGNSGEATSQTTIHSDEIVLPDVKPMTGEEGQEGGNQAFPVALVTHLPPDLILRTEETITGDKEENSDKDKNNEKRENETGEATTFTTTGTSVASQWQSLAVPTTAMADYLSRLPSTGLPLSLHHFLKFSAETIKRESAIESSPLNPDGEQGTEEGVDEPQVPIAELTDDSKGGKKKKKYKKKPPKPRRPRPGQVHIAVALDGTTLFCCPECNMAYPDKEILEQHLVAHKIERRFICDICGAGLKRKEHLERHKLGHNPERPYICSVCCKGFKRKEHLNLHFVIHSGEKSEVCPECGKGFHRKDHLRKHARSHLAKRVKEEPVTHTLVEEGVISDSGTLQASAATENNETQSIILHQQATQSQH
ncbi:zinc finger and BTB domain-containing protein 49-like isoform X2 [Cimex lectularius]|uniref:C2H2-type domain-containing protein n=1 Tax=Cimex lectularius TaxID=79782 RepID=A0A8I6RP05_CIMLE|nr:zinc finger and BTB domain-containing protein 49-like isoform X2 [Cimex lectularius]